MAQASMAEEEKKSRTISFRVVDAVYDEFAQQCRTSNISKSELFRDYITKNKVQVIARPAPSRDAKRAVFLLQKASNNINQLAHRANVENQAGRLSDQTFLDINTQLTKIAAMLLDGTRVN